MCDLDKRVQAATEAEIAEKLRTTREVFQLEAAPEEDLRWAARSRWGSIGWWRFCLHGLTYYYRGLDGNGTSGSGPGSSWATRC